MCAARAWAREWPPRCWVNKLSPEKKKTPQSCIDNPAGIAYNVGRQRLYLPMGHPSQPKGYFEQNRQQLQLLGGSHFTYGSLHRLQ